MSMLAEMYGPPSSLCCRCTGNLVKSACAPVHTTWCTGAALEEISIGAIGASSRRDTSARSSCSATPKASASRRRLPSTLPTSSAFSGPTARNSTAFGLPSRCAPMSTSSTGLATTSSSPSSAKRSTVRRSRKRSKSVSCFAMRAP